MRLPQSTASYTRRVRYGRYLLRKLVHGRQGDLVQGLKDATGEVLAAGRAVEELRYDEAELLAQRDAWDDALDVQAREVHLALRSRGLNAHKERPFTQIFPQGLGYYTVASLKDQVSRYKLFMTALETSLAEDDPVRVSAMGVLREGVEGWEQAAEALASHRNKMIMARTELLLAQDDWERVVERIYGLLVAEFGRDGARRFFPAAARTALSDSAVGSDDDLEPT